MDPRGAIAYCLCDECAAKGSPDEIGAMAEDKLIVEFSRRLN